MEAEELIRKHIMGNCSLEEAELVNQRLLSDPEFEKTYHEMKALMIGIGQSERDRLKQVLQAEDKKTISK